MGYILRELNKDIDCNTYNCLPQNYDIASITQEIDGKEVSIVYGTTNEFEVDYKGNTYYSYEDLIKEHKELDCKNWVDIIENNNGWIQAVPICCFKYYFNDELKTIYSTDLLDTNAIYPSLIEEMEYIEKNFNTMFEHYKDTELEME